MFDRLKTAFLITGIISLLTFLLVLVFGEYPEKRVKGEALSSSFAGLVSSYLLYCLVADVEDAIKDVLCS